MARDNSTRGVYNRLVLSYKKKVKSEDKDHRHIERFLLMLQPGQSVLDVGAGTGALAEEMTELHQLKVTAIDVSEEMIKLAKKERPKLSYLKMDMRSLAFPPKSFDAIFANYSLIHILDDDVPDTLKGFARVIKPKGCLYLALQSPMKSKDYDGYYPVVYKRDAKLFINLFEKDEIISSLKNAGFRVLFTALRKPDMRTEFPFNKLIVIAQKR